MIQTAPDFLLPSTFSTSTGFATLEITSDQPLSIDGSEPKATFPEDSLRVGVTLVSKDVDS
jgi:hypothetical protein